LARCDEYVWLYFEGGNWNAPGEILSDWKDAVVAARATTSVPPLLQKPSVELVSPATGSRFVGPASITFTVSASAGDVGIDKIEFFSGATKLGETFDGPFIFKSARL